MKKILGIIVLVGLLVLIGFGFTYKMVEPDGWDRIVETVVEQVPVLENIIAEKTPEPQPTATPAPTAEPQNNQQSGSSASSEKSETNVQPTATPEATVAPSATPAPSTTPENEFSAENMDYETYLGLTGEEQETIFKTFENPQDFFNWFNKIKEEYNENNQDIIIDGGNINLDDIIGNKNEG